MLYAAEFNLVRPVTDFEAARDYLLADNASAVGYAPSGIAPKLESIDWLLIAPDRGYVVIRTCPFNALHAEERMALSNWIAGQCSDDLGEGFEEQPFASFRDDDTDDYEPFASFNWIDDKYELVPLASIDPIDLDTLASMYPEIVGPEN